MKGWSRLPRIPEFQGKLDTMIGFLAQIGRSRCLTAVCLRSFQNEASCSLPLPSWVKCRSSCHGCRKSLRSSQRNLANFHTMCHNVVDGRYHPECGCFYGMATTKQDCYRPDCHFSSRHGPCSNDPRSMRNCSGIRMMASPARNPIRISPTMCPGCIQQARDGDPTSLFRGRARG